MAENDTKKAETVSVPPTAGIDPKTTDDGKLIAAPEGAPFVGASADEVRRLSSQPVGLVPDGDVVAMVSRDSSGHPRQSENFVVMVPEGVSDAERAAHWNTAGEDQGAKHLKGGVREQAPAVGSWDDLTPEQRAERAEVEGRELARHNFRETAKA